MLRDLILYRCHIERKDSRVKITYDNVYKTDLPEELEEEKQELGDYLKVLFSLIEGESFDIGDLKKILQLCGVDEGMAFILAGFNALLNKDLVRVHDMFDFDQFKNEIDDMELVHSIIKLGSGKWNQESLEKVIREIIISQNLFTHHDVDEKIKEFVKSAEFRMVKNTLRGIDGDMQSLGQVCDYIFFNNKSWVCTLFAVMSEGKLTMMNLCDDQDRPLAKKKFQKDVKRLYERLFSVACDHPKLDDFIYKYDVPVLMFAMMCPNLGLVERFFNYKDSLTFLENDIIGTITNFASVQELVPTLYCAFRTAKPVLEEKFDVEIEQVDDDHFPINIPNFEFTPNPIMQKMGKIYDSLNFDINAKNGLMSPEKEELYLTDYNYQINEDGIRINAPKLFKLIFQAGYGDNSALFALVDILTPIFRNITGGIAVLKIALVLAKNRKDKIFDHMANLVRLIIIGMITDKIEMKTKFAEEEEGSDFTEEDIRKLSESFNFTDNLVKGIVMWIKGALLLLDKNAANIKVDRYREVFYGMCDSLSEYEKEIQRRDVLVHDIAKQTDLMIAIVGLCKGNYRKVEIIGVQVGCFEHAKVRELMNILNKYKSIMFRGNVFGLPNFTIPVPISGVLDDIKDGASQAWDHTKAGAKAAGKAVVDGTKAAINGIGSGIHAAYDGIGDGFGAAGRGISGGFGSAGRKLGGMSYGGVTMPGFPNMPGLKKVKFPSLGKMPNLMPNLSSLNPDKLVFGDIFKQFDKDRSGYIDYNEFCELTKYMGLFLDKEESLKLFSMADRSKNNQIEMREFKYAMALLKMRIAYETLRKLGLTIEDLVWYGIFGMIFLLLVFIFIFLGISAFSKAEGFNAVINSLLPLTAGAAAAARKIDIQGAFEKVKGFVQNTISRLKSR